MAASYLWYSNPSRFNDSLKSNDHEISLLPLKTLHRAKPISQQRQMDAGVVWGLAAGVESALSPQAHRAIAAQAYSAIASPSKSN